MPWSWPRHPGVCRGSWVGACVWQPHTCAGSQSNFQDAGACQLPGVVAQFASYFCGQPGSQLPPRRASVPPCLHSILQAQTLCGSKPGGPCPWHSRISRRRRLETGEGKGPWTLPGLGARWSSREVKSTVKLSGSDQLWSMCTSLAGEGSSGRLWGEV